MNVFEWHIASRCYAVASRSDEIFLYQPLPRSTKATTQSALAHCSRRSWCFTRSSERYARWVP
ncbi:hypothetical protein BOTBODRAFT_231340 [Botryobasidium botryosum FD-172 SS1]|uniref:Uncharacterized protein n=1 Tax=Botryobasidium botryosum (strain FD-172 SS1) TaxID=930990 RepID=A0A067M5V9_BOTB1|nr:hypothetical protein BOTBODRAFT_231340 [Botryobasidium botryosum FD-172 SS1]